MSGPSTGTTGRDTRTSRGRAFDLVLLGASGFTGRLVAEHLDRRLAGTGRRWALAGRDPDKLASVASTMDSDPTIEVVDVTDHQGLSALARRTRVLGTTVGPYARHGEPVAHACVEAGTHYADIAGEPAFVDRLHRRHDAEARRRGVKLVTCCGFDSVPHDLGVRFTVAHLRDDAHVTMRGYVRAEGRLSGGTARSAVDAIADGRDRRPGRGPHRLAIREVAPLPARVHRVASVDAWGIPLPTIDASVVLRSARVLDGYGRSFRYGHYARVRRLPVALRGIVLIGAGVAMASVPPTRRLLHRILPEPGNGPDAATRDRSRFDVTFLGSADDERVMTRVSGGDPGYGETSRMLGEALLSLVEDDGPDVAGVLTPALGLGQPYHERLVEQGIRFEVLSR